MPEIEEDDGHEAAGREEQEKECAATRSHERLLNTGPHGDYGEHSDNRGKDIAPDDERATGVLERDIRVGTA